MTDMQDWEPDGADNEDWEPDEADNAYTRTTKFEKQALTKFHSKLKQYLSRLQPGLSRYCTSDPKKIVNLLNELKELSGHLILQEYKHEYIIDGLYGVQASKSKPRLLRLTGGADRCFELFTKNAHVHYGRTPNESIVVITNQPKGSLKKLLNEEITDVLDKNGEIIKLHKLFDPVAIYAFGAVYERQEQLSLPSYLEVEMTVEELDYVKEIPKEW